VVEESVWGQATERNNFLLQNFNSYGGSRNLRDPLVPPTSAVYVLGSINKIWNWYGPTKYSSHLALQFLLHYFHLVLNIGTSSQLAVVADKDTTSRSVVDFSTLLQVPYFAGKHLVVAAALTGGNALAHFIKQLQSWCSELGISAPTKDSIYQSLFESASKVEKTSLHITPLLWGERHIPSGRGVVSGLDTSNSSLGDITNAICRGIITNIREMMPPEVFRASKVCM